MKCFDRTSFLTAQARRVAKESAAVNIGRLEALRELGFLFDLSQRFLPGPKEAIDRKVQADHARHLYLIDNEVLKPPSPPFITGRLTPRLTIGFGGSVV